MTATDRWNVNEYFYILHGCQFDLFHKCNIVLFLRVVFRDSDMFIFILWTKIYATIVYLFRLHANLFPYLNQNYIYIYAREFKELVTTALPPKWSHQNSSVPAGLQAHTSCPIVRGRAN